MPQAVYKKKKKDKTDPIKKRKKSRVDCVWNLEFKDRWHQRPRPRLNLSGNSLQVDNYPGVLDKYPWAWYAHT